VSTAAGIAAVTAVLKDLLSNGLIDRDVVNAVGDVTVSVTAPDRITLPETNSQLNLYLYLVSRNTGWANVDLPSRDQRGNLVAAPPLALDLHYLLTAYGAQELHAELLLGYAMQLLHEMPVLTRPAIRNALTPSLLVDDGDVPANLRDLFRSGLADQIEQIKITPCFLSTEAMSNLWLAFSAPYRPTAVYQVSVVLIESVRQGAGAPPVRDFTVSVGTLRQPSIDELRSRSAPDQEFRADRPILKGDEVALAGRRLRGDLTQVFVADLEVTDGLEVTDTQISFPLPPGLPAGIHPVHVAHLVAIGLPPSPHRGIESNAVALTLRPSLVAVTATVDQGDGGSGPAVRKGTISLTVAPPVGRDQRVTLLLNELSPPAASVRPALAYRFSGPPRNLPGAPPQSATLTVPFVDVQPASYLVRLRVDGAESPLGVGASGAYESPSLVIP
jgi:Pvc16 N-terminal domain